MNTQAIIKVAISILLYTFIQVFILRNLVFFDVAFCFVYISVFLFLPNNTSTSVALIIAFITGLLVDMVYNTAGLHASASVLIAFLRNSIVRAMFPSKIIDNDLSISLETMRLNELFRYIFVVTLIHHTYLFFVEAGSLNFFLNTGIKVLASTVFSTIIIFILHIYLKSLRNS